VWHASGSTPDRNPREGRRLARAGLSGVGDAELGEWAYEGERPGIFHVLRRLTTEEREAFGVPEPYDIRGTPEEQRRVAAVLNEASYLRAHFPWLDEQRR
jgi:hypothetical protein